MPADATRRTIMLGPAAQGVGHLLRCQFGPIGEMDDRSLAHAQSHQCGKNIRIESLFHLDGIAMHDTEFSVEPAPGAASGLVRLVEEHPVEVGALVVGAIEAGRRNRLGDGRSEEILCI